ncbi:uncharacterized protein LOC133368678 isoform X2 [Rhineura floridana]|uniref:uncharacterized protein LOC133368678 isoform X2 n=1 Tax=Rhineura floridana TaxID=261503 RepID=UPI002AC818E3|nr:uncharacterized protein LOC133368678 isoform X2 [Rhineura floridana]
MSVMASQRTRWNGIRGVLCCRTPKDGRLDPQQQQEESGNVSGILVASQSDTKVQDSPSIREHQAMDMSSQDIEAVYQKRTHDLEQELHAAVKNNRELSCQLNEIGRLVFPELSDSTQLSLTERLKVYLECQLMEKEELERRAVKAEETIVEMKRTVAVLQRNLPDADHSPACLMNTLERHPPGHSEAPFSTQAHGRMQEDALTTTSTLPVTALLSGGGDDGHGLPSSYVVNAVPCTRSPGLVEFEVENLSVWLNIVYLQQTLEGKHQSKEGEVLMGVEKSAPESATNKAVGLAGHAAPQRPDVPIDFPDSDAHETKPMPKQDLQVACPSAKDASGDDSLDSGRSLAICYVHRGDHTADLEPGTNQILTGEQSPGRLGLLKNPAEVSPQLSLPVSLPKAEGESFLKGGKGHSWGENFHLPSISAKPLTTQTLTVTKMCLEGPLRVEETKDESYISAKEKLAVVITLDAETGELLSASPTLEASIGSYISSSMQSSRPALPTKESPEDLTEESSPEVFV